jgi:hypothetical protein
MLTTQPFVFGRIARDGKRVVVLQPAAAAAFPGPWELRAITTAPRAPKAPPTD